MRIKNTENFHFKLGSIRILIIKNNGVEFYKEIDPNYKN